VTVFLADISSYEHGLSIADLHDCVGVLAKCSEGVYYGDADYNGWRQQTAALGKIFVAYDFVKDNETANAQAAWIADRIVDKSLPLMLDVETEGASKPSFGQVVALIKACKARGLRPKLVYLPYWYWQQIGSPDMSVLNTLGVGLISSSYPNLTIAAAGQVYVADGGDKGKGWNSYGGVAPMLWQFSDRILDGGKTMDMNAYRGTAAQLAAFLGTAAPQTPTDLGDAMGTIPASIGQKWPEIAADFPANGQFDNDTALIYGDAGARAAALYAKQARDAVNALAAKIQQPPAVDVKALAAALQPLLTTGATADQIATAVMHHLSAATANG
jgi:hypothetical protein